MGKHTPGPWNVTDYDRRVFVEPTGRAPTGEYICEVGLPTGDLVFEDAHLIAAAPELLAACEMTLDLMTQYGGACAVGRGIDLREACRAAIAKARGEPTSNPNYMPTPGTSVEAARRHHAEHGDMDGHTCLLSACALHYPRSRE